MVSLRFALRFVASCCLLASAALAQVPDGYEVVVLSSQSGFYQRPEINNRSHVVWSRSTPPISNVYVYTGGDLRRLTTNDRNDHWPGMNNTGAFVWKSALVNSPPYDLGMYQNGSISTMPGAWNVFSIPEINDDGTIVWSHDVTGDGLNVQIFRSVAGAVEQISNEPFTNQTPRINIQGDIVWVRYDFNVSPWRSTVMLYHDGETIELTDGSAQPQLADINDVGQVAWGEVDGASHAVRLWTRGEAVTLTEGLNPRMNNWGEVSFGRWNFDLDKWDTWLYRQGEFFRLPDFGFSSSGGDINDRGEVAWPGLVGSSTRAILMLRRVAQVGDFDDDCRVGLLDFGCIQRCFTGTEPGAGEPMPAHCTRADMDGDWDVDLADFEIFQGAAEETEGSIDGCAP